MTDRLTVWPKKLGVQTPKTRAKNRNVKFIPEVPKNPPDLEKYGTLFHGSDTIVDEPEIRLSTWPLEFGDGFYTTSDRLQASEWGINRTKENSDPWNDDQAKVRFRSHIPSVSMFKLDVKKARKELNILVFNYPCPEWLDFLADSFGREQSKWADIVIGPTADDNFKDIVKIYREERNKGLNPDPYLYISLLEEGMQTDQILFASKRSLKYLKYVGCLVWI